MSDLISIMKSETAGRESKMSWRKLNDGTHVSVKRIGHHERNYYQWYHSHPGGKDQLPGNYGLTETEARELLNNVVC